MSAIRIVAAGAVSPVGLGWRLHDVPDVDEAPICRVVRDVDLAAAGLRRPNVARAPSDLGVPATADRAADLLTCALQELCDELRRTLPGWRELRIGVALGSSSGGMLVAEQLYAAWASAAPVTPPTLCGATYFAPFCDALRRVGIDVGQGTGRACSALPATVGSGTPPLVPHRYTQVLAACASSTLAIGLGMRWLERGSCDLVLAGGYDALSLFVAAGFEAIRATTASRPRPFRLGRDGMALGEGACVLALERADGGRPGPAPLAFLRGFGASDDAVHITAPDRTGAGLARAGRAALDEAGLAPRSIGLVSAHGTATPYNDAMEAKAIAAVCGDGASPPVHPYKAEIGHTLGAAGALELLVALQGLRRQRVPAACGEGELDPEAPVTLLASSAARRLDAALKLSAAFGGATAALVLAREAAPEAPRPGRDVYVHGVGVADQVCRETLAAATGVARDRLARMDELSQLSVAAVAALVAEVGRERVAGAGVVLGHGLATFDVNQRFYGRLRERGPRFVDPRLFPATSPNAAAGHCAIAFGLTGPNFAVGAGLGGALEALEVAAELVAAGDAEQMIALGADDLGPGARRWLAELGIDHRPAERGAVAVLLSAREPVPSAAGWVVDDRPWRSPTGQRERHERGPLGQLALRRWVEQHRPRSSFVGPR